MWAFRFGSPLRHFAAFAAWRRGLVPVLVLGVELGQVVSRVAVTGAELQDLLEGPPGLGVLLRSHEGPGLEILGLEGARILGEPLLGEVGRPPPELLPGPSFTNGLGTLRVAESEELRGAGIARLLGQRLLEGVRGGLEILVAVL